jgi:hypothetical protein
MTNESQEAARAEYQKLYEEHAALEREMAQLGRADVPLQDPDHVLQRSEQEQLAWWGQVGDLHRLSHELLGAWHRYETLLHHDTGAASGG